MFHPEDISYYIISLGCSKNLVDSENINGALYSSGFRIAPSPEKADIIIINTCGFIEDAKKESIEVILDAASLKEIKKKNTGARKKSRDNEKSGFIKKLVVAGCLTKRYAREIAEDMPEIDFVYGLLDDGFVLSMSNAFDISTPGKALNRKPLLESLPYRYIKISEGCSNGCSFCAIPLIRGRRISFNPESIIHDAESAVRDGAKELIIIAQDTASYEFDGVRLADLVERISKIDGVEWIRLLYCHPERLDEDLIKLLESNDKVVKYLDIPFQHASRTVLRAMGRSGNAEQYLELLSSLRRRIPEIKIRSTFMVGFPGESEEDFSMLLNFIKTACIERIGCFMYSREEGTSAARLQDSVPERTKKSRYKKLMKLQAAISREKMGALIGKTVRVIVEEQVDEATWMGRSEFDAPEVDGVFYLTGKNIMVNSIVRACVTDASEYDLIGVLD